MAFINQCCLVPHPMVISFGFGPVSPDISGMIKRPTPMESLGAKLGRPGLKSQHPHRLLGRLGEHWAWVIREDMHGADGLIEDHS
jgi:hypothetical protein